MFIERRLFSETSPALKNSWLRACKRVDKFQQTCKTETFSNLELVSEINLVATNDTSWPTNFQNKMGRPMHN